MNFNVLSLTINIRRLGSSLKRSLLKSFTLLNKQPGSGGVDSKASFIEYTRVLFWLLRDPLRPSFARAMGPTAFLFLSATIQAAILGGIVSYIALSGQDWQLVLYGVNLDLTPSFPIVLVVGAIATTVTLIIAIGNYWAATRILNLGLIYQERCAERLLYFYRAQINRLNDIRKVHLPSEKLMPLINSDARYIGRALVMLFFGLNPLFTLVVGGIILSITSPWFVLVGVGVMAISLLSQKGVMERGVRFSRLMLSQSAKNSLALSNAVRTVTSAPAPTDISNDDLHKQLQAEEIAQYNKNYYNRLRVSQLNALVSQSIYAVVLGFFAIIGLLLVANQNASVTEIATVFFGLRFFLGGVTGIVGSAVSIVALKAYFDSYPQLIPAKDIQEDEGQTEYFSHSNWTEGLVVRIENGVTESLEAGAWVGVALAGARPTWLDVARLLERIGATSMLSKMCLTEDVSLIPVDPPLLRSGIRASLGLGAKVNFSKLMDRLSPLRSDLIEIERLISLSEGSTHSSEEIWAQFSPRLLVVAGLAGALEKGAAITFISEAGLRTIPERERMALKILLQETILVIMYARLPSVDMLPRANRFALVDEVGIFTWMTERQSITELSNYTKSRFALSENRVSGSVPLEI